ncbi:hypothetical protein KY290_005417 [Solanum tuberosum]|uniref:Peptidase M24 C-terminal domain-containing protein n=1 Tax=Solanum tuberosum TaxID=4113 RepID=A0ABQ7WE34_SOLTU|nr:hypothetical protein KY289_005812 [Solanum tuberosum]KAH0778990.1 hypothetical protein KY290_005417 [Solanum tuberosum]
MNSDLAYIIKPGYYEDGKFGIRLENVLIFKEGNTKFNFGDKGYLTFELITWPSVPEEIQWFNDYHSKCSEIFAPYLNQSEMEWLKNATAPIAA